MSNCPSGLKKGPDMELINQLINEESSGGEKLSNAIESTEDPKFKELLQAMQQDEDKHLAALQQFKEMAQGGGEGEEGGDEGLSEEGEDEGLSPEDEGEAPGGEDESLDFGEIPEGGEEEEEGIKEEKALEEPTSDASKDLADEIQEILTEFHEKEAEKSEEGMEEEEEEGEDETEKSEDGDDKGEEDEDDEDLPDFLKDAEGLEGEDEGGVKEETEKSEDEDEDDFEKLCHKSYRAVEKAFKIPILLEKSALPKKIVYGVVSEPGTVDLQGDRMTPETIEKACHDFMLKSQQLGFEHQEKAGARIIESYIAPANLILGGQTVKKGSWIIATKIFQDRLWKSICDGEVTGFSIAGHGNRTPV